MPRNPLFIDAEWKRWIAENTLLGAPPQQLAEILKSHGFDHAHAQLEVETARNHPYIAAALSLAHQLQKRDWVLHTQRMLRDAHAGEITEVDAWMSNELFFQDFYAMNRPLVVRGAVKDWPAISRWNQKYLVERIGDQAVQIQAGRTKNQNYESQSSRHRQMIPFEEFLQQVFSEIESNDMYMTAQNGSVNSALLAPLCSDLNPLPNILENEDCFKRIFFWIGSSGTVTPLHHDLTNNLMAQVVGRKRVKLIAPDCLPYLYNHTRCYSDVDPERVDVAKFPLFQRVRVHEVVLSPGDVLFLPVGWWHHVRSLDPSITITATGFRGINQFTEHYPND